jgi:hypothetical protein
VYYAMPADATNSGPIQWAACLRWPLTNIYKLTSLCDVNRCSGVRREEMERIGGKMRELEPPHSNAPPLQPSGHEVSLTQLLGSP